MHLNSPDIPSKILLTIRNLPVWVLGGLAAIGYAIARQRPFRRQRDLSTFGDAARRCNLSTAHAAPEPSARRRAIRRRDLAGTTDAANEFVHVHRWDSERLSGMLCVPLPIPSKLFFP
jgi:hypothetical protein